MLRPMSLYEMKLSSGEISLEKLFDKNYDFETKIKNTTLDEIIDFVLSGG
jgi:hypothetical protein